MKTLITLLLLTGSMSFASDAPSAYYVAASILKDSGIDDASHVSGTHVGTERFGTDNKTTHILRFNRGAQSFSCDYIFMASPVSAENFAVRAELSNCMTESGNRLVLNNDYTGENGVALFERLFFNNNREFRPLTSQEREIFASRSRRTLRDDSNVRIINPANSDRIILLNEGQVIPIN